jgi:hypothetical protein
VEVPQEGSGGLSEVRARRQARRRARLWTTLGLGVTFAGAAIVRHDYFGVPMSMAVGLCLGFTWMKVAPPFYRRRAASRRRATGALYASPAMLEDVERLKATPALASSLSALHWPWWTRHGLGTLGSLPGVLWIVSDDAGAEMGWEPSWLARRCGATPWWLSPTAVASAIVSEGTVLLDLVDGTKVSFLASSEGLRSALEGVALPLVADGGSHT